MSIGIILRNVKPGIRRPAVLLAGACLAGILAIRCSDAGGSADGTPDPAIATDGDLFRLVTQTSPYTSYPLFPGVDSVASPTLNGSAAHRPAVRVSLNPTALGSLQADTLREGTVFADGSVVLKEIREGGATTLLAVMYKDPENSLSSGGWLWAEYTPAGGVIASIQGRGAGCVPCHSRERGPANDLVRTFERRHP